MDATLIASLAVLRETGDGFEIARRDTQLRCPGEVLGMILAVFTIEFVYRGIMGRCIHLANRMLKGCTNKEAS